MKESIYTIPVMEGFEEEHECPFCSMKNKLEKDTINFVLGPSYMEDDVRTETNKYGFCNDHLEKLYKEKNRLGLALMLHTHMVKTREELTKLLEQDQPSSINLFKKFLSKTDKGSNKPSELDNFIKSKLDGCYICSRIDTTFNRYVDTFFYLLKNESKMSEKIEQCQGFCLEHFYMLYSKSPNHLNEKQLEGFLNILIPSQLKHLKRVEDDLEWFTMKFDHRYKEESWKNSKDALPRAMVKMNSLHLE